jgi:hypothetical protein
MPVGLAWLFGYRRRGRPQPGLETAGAAGQEFSLAMMRPDGPERAGATSMSEGRQSMMISDAGLVRDSSSTAGLRCSASHA